MQERSLFQRKAVGEEALLEGVELGGMWDLVEKFSTLYRHSSDPDEFKAVDYLCERLASYGVPFEKHEAALYLSLPRGAGLTADGKEYGAKTPSFSTMTPAGGVTGELVYIPLDAPECFADVSVLPAKAQGRIVVTEWPSAAEESTRQLAVAGAAGVVYIQPGDRIHEDTCTTIWGSPEMSSMGRIPTVPVVNVNRAAGDALVASLETGKTVNATLQTKVDTGWKKTHLVVAEIKGTTYPDEFVLLHGHLDSWHVGVGDNATGNATMLEAARVIWANREHLERSVRIAWWTGHSTGRYAGSTWYADKFGVDLAQNCVANVNCDSPGCRWASDLTAPTSMAELREFTKQAVLDVSGQEAKPGRPHRAGDYSFVNMGISSTMMLSSRVPPEVVKAKGMHGVGGCGGNNEWHTEADTMEIADKDLLLRDTKLYALIVWRLANLPVNPADYGATAREIAEFASKYQGVCGGLFDLSRVVAEAEELAKNLVQFYVRLDLKTDQFDHCDLARVNALQRLIARELVEIDYTHEGKFHQDPAAPLVPVPDLSWAKDLAALDPNSDEFGFTKVSLARGKNRVLYALRRARAYLDQANGLLKPCSCGE